MVTAQSSSTDNAPASADEQELSLGTLTGLYEQMARIRAFETRVHELASGGELPGFLHLCAGQEAVAAGVIAQLRPTDSITSTHRNHGHALAKGVRATAIMAELFGRVTGTNRARGGSMHIADPASGHFASGGVVGAGAPLALGPALAAKLDGSGAVAIAFFGDGGAQQGTVLESMNLAAVWRLPVVFVCENNVFGQATPVGYAASTPPACRAAGFGLASETVNGQDVAAVYAAAGWAVQRARDGRGPTYLECLTYSYYGAWEGETQVAYRLPDLEQDFHRRDPVALADARLAARDPQWPARRDEITARLSREVDAAVTYGRASEEPSPSGLCTGVYADPVARVDRDGLAEY